MTLTLPEQITTLMFPYNVVETIWYEVQKIIPAAHDRTFRRPLRQTDPNPSVGVFSIDWQPTQYDIGHPDPAISTYLFGVQGFVKHASEEEALREHAELSKKIRAMLYRGESLRLALASLSDTLFGFTERTLRWGVRTQRFVNNEIQRNFLYLSTAELWLETESTY